MKRILVVLALAAVVAQGSVAQAATPKATPHLTYIGVTRMSDTTLGVNIRAKGVNSTWVVETTVTYFLSGQETPEPAVTLKFSSGAGSSEWGTSMYVTGIAPSNATQVGVDASLIQQRKSTAPADHVYRQDDIPATGGINLYGPVD